MNTFAVKYTQMHTHKQNKQPTNLPNKQTKHQREMEGRKIKESKVTSVA